MSVQPSLIPRPQILVIDDSRVIRKAIEKILNTDFNLHEAADGEAGWKSIMADDDIKVVVSDVEMPQLDGYGLICRIRAHDNERIRDLPVIIVTGADDDQTRERAFACGATDFITKPIDRQQLLSRARAHAHLDDPAGVSEKKTLSESEKSGIDPVTKLISRQHFLQHAATSIAHARQHGGELSIVRVGIDGLREFYDRHGDEAFQNLLTWLTPMLRANSRPEDTVARLQGGDFALLTLGLDRLNAAMQCERLRTAVAATPFKWNKQDLPITISLGLVTLGRDPGDTIEALLGVAEQRLTLAKAAGGNRLGSNYREHAPAPDEAVIERPDLEAATAMIANGKGGQLLPYLPELIGRVIPLLEFGDRQLDLEFGIALESLKERLRDLK